MSDDFKKFSINGNGFSAHSGTKANGDNYVFRSSMHLGWSQLFVVAEEIEGQVQVKLITSNTHARGNGVAYRPGVVDPLVTNSLYRHDEMLATIQHTAPLANVIDHQEAQNYMAEYGLNWYDSMEQRKHYEGVEDVIKDARNPIIEVGVFPLNSDGTHENPRSFALALSAIENAIESSAKDIRAQVKFAISTLNGKDAGKAQEELQSGLENGSARSR